MKTRYTFTIPSEIDIKDLNSALCFLKVKPEIVENNSSTEFTAELSKYELLFLRLTLKKGVFRKTVEMQ